MKQLNRAILAGCLIAGAPVSHAQENQVPSQELMQDPETRAEIQSLLQFLGGQNEPACQKMVNFRWVLQKSGIGEFPNEMKEMDQTFLDELSLLIRLRDDPSLTATEFDDLHVELIIRQSSIIERIRISFDEQLLEQFDEFSDEQYSQTISCYGAMGFVPDADGSWRATWQMT